MFADTRPGDEFMLILLFSLRFYSLALMIKSHADDGLSVKRRNSLAAPAAPPNWYFNHMVLFSNTLCDIFPLFVIMHMKCSRRACVQNNFGVSGRTTHSTHYYFNSNRYKYLHEYYCHQFARSATALDIRRRATHSEVVRCLHSDLCVFSPLRKSFFCLTNVQVGAV